ncbi:hypothetical protein DKP76_16750 [Falsochrobactrum shanghaiense]|uniref:Uncharacterized protein n=1 Tax=Falsochrobactrum shanghaiense TaxID=2201899 RepID=A0A316J4L1_9HYPH|nr:hypothetical protein [Falsochrobactrum shanghaiense]PWL16614.1 hypothetical protein DKP76_16750 [Falsochrobactrum shanghaiense]
MKTNSPKKSAGARIRGSVQKGETGDKVPGFDPAAAPMETDAEAGGSSFPDNDAIPRSDGNPTKATESNASSHASGLRGWDSEESTHSSGRNGSMRKRPAFLFCLFILALIVVGFVFGSVRQ